MVKCLVTPHFLPIFTRVFQIHFLSDSLIVRLAHCMNDSTQEHIAVAVRVRPLNAREVTFRYVTLFHS